jgi:hypothetical protein
MKAPETYSRYVEEAEGAPTMVALKMALCTKRPVNPGWITGLFGVW